MVAGNLPQLEPIEVRQYGASGPDLIALHGGPGAPGSVAALALDLSSDFRVQEPLQRRAGAEPLSVELHVRDLAAVAPPRAVVVGWSWGAMLGLSYAARHPRRVSRLILVGCGTYDEGCRELLIRTRSERLGDAGRARQRELEERLRSERDPKGRDLALASLGKLFSALDSYDLLDEAALAPVPAPLPVDSVGSVQTWQDVLRLQSEGIEPQIFANIAVPVLMLHGDHDPHPGPCTCTSLRQYVPQLEYVELEKCGHQPWRERHARTRFLDTLRAWSSAP